MPPVYQPTPDISSNLRRHQKKINFWLSYAIKQCPIWRTVERDLSIPNMHKTIEFQSLLFTISHLSPIGDLGPIAKKKNLYNPESIGTLKSPWKLVTSVIALSLPDLNTHIMIHVLQLNNNHVHSYFCLKEIFNRVF